MQVSALGQVNDLNTCNLRSSKNCFNTFCCFALFTRRRCNRNMMWRMRWDATSQPVTFICNTFDISVIVINFLQRFNLSSVMKFCNQRLCQETPAEMPSDPYEKAHRSMKALALAVWYSKIYTNHARTCHCQGEVMSNVAPNDDKETLTVVSICSLLGFFFCAKKNLMISLSGGYGGPSGCSVWWYPASKGGFDSSHDWATFLFKKYGANDLTVRRLWKAQQVQRLMMHCSQRRLWFISWLGHSFLFFVSSAICYMLCKAPSINSCGLMCKESIGLDGHHVSPTSPPLTRADSFDSTAGAPPWVTVVALSRPYWWYIISSWYFIAWLIQLRSQGHSLTMVLMMRVVPRLSFHRRCASYQSCIHTECASLIWFPSRNLQALRWRKCLEPPIFQKPVPEESFPKPSYLLCQFLPFCIPCSPVSLLMFNFFRFPCGSLSLIPEVGPESCPQSKVQSKVRCEGQRQRGKSKGEGKSAQPKGKANAKTKTTTKELKTDPGNVYSRAYHEAKRRGCSKEEVQRNVVASQGWDRDQKNGHKSTVGLISKVSFNDLTF